MKLLFLCLFFVSLSGMVTAQNFEGEPFEFKKRLIDTKVSVKKTGPYFGLQQGKFLVAEIGGERQWKQIRLLQAQTHAAHMGFNYNFKYKVLGYDVGYWWKPNRIGLTYGGNLFLRSDFNRTKFGFAPVIGFKTWLLHLQTGYHFMPRPNDFETNTFFISLRIGIINDRDIEFKK